MSDATQILSQIEQGDPSRADQLLPLVYAELRQLAAARLMKELPGQTMQGTALVHEAYLRLVDVEKAQHWNSRGHFFAAAAEAMKRILVDHARKKRALRRGGNLRRTELSGLPMKEDKSKSNLEAVSEAIEDLEKDYPQIASIVKLKYFCGLTLDEIADALDISVSTVKRKWMYARARLHADLAPND